MSYDNIIEEQKISNYFYCFVIEMQLSVSHILLASIINLKVPLLPLYCTQSFCDYHKQHYLINYTKIICG